MSTNERLRQARRAKGYRFAADAARALGVPYGTYSGHESGARGIKPADIERYAAFFGVTPAWLLWGEGDAPPPPADAPATPARRNSIRLYREASGMSLAQLAERVGCSRQNLSTMERGMQSVSRDWAERIGRALNVRPDALLADPAELVAGGEGLGTVPLVGYIGAGQEVFAVDDHAQGAGLDQVPRPAGAPTSTVAVKVKGESMYPLYGDGTVIYYSRHLPAGEMIGKTAVVRTRDGRSFVKTVKRGSRPGLWTLESLNHPPIDDVTIEWAAPIDWVKPA